MFIVKSCESKYNPFDCHTIRIGSIDEYRHTKNAEIADPGEATFDISVELKNTDISMEFFEKLQSAAGLLGSMQGHSWNDFRQSRVIKGGIRIKEMNSQHRWEGLNSLAFCMSRLDDHKKASKLFELYDDYWYFKESNLKSIGEILRKQVERQVRQDMLDSGNEKSLTQLKNFSMSCKIQNVIYSKRHVKISNANHQSRSPDFLNDLYNNYKFLKPVEYSHENEIRFIFESFHDGNIIHPAFNDLIIDADPLLKYIIRK